MAMTEIKAKVGDGKPVVVQYDFGDNLGAMAKKFGEDVVFTNARANFKIGLQDIVRSGIKAGKSAGDIQKDINAYFTGFKKLGKSKAEKLQDQFTDLSPEEKKELLSRLTG